MGNLQSSNFPLSQSLPIFHTTSLILNAQNNALHPPASWQRPGRLWLRIHHPFSYFHCTSHLTHYFLTVNSVTVSGEICIHFLHFVLLCNVLCMYSHLNSQGLSFVSRNLLKMIYVFWRRGELQTSIGDLRRERRFDSFFARVTNWPRCRAAAARSPSSN